MPSTPVRPQPLRGRVFRGTWAVRQGLLTEAQLRSRAWRRLRRDVYADSTVPVTHALHAKAVALVMPRPGALGGLTAALLWGARDLVSADDPVDVVLPPGTRWDPGPGVVVRTADLQNAVVTDGRWLRWTDRVRTAVDLIRRGERDDGVVLLDQLVHADVVELVSVRAAVAALPRCRGSRLAREVAALADGRAQSPQETRLRLLLARGGLPTPVAQYVVRDGGRFVAQVDFAFPRPQLAVEYDGLVHAGRERLGPDRARLNRLTAAGWRVVFVTAADMHRPEELLARIARALAC